VTDAPVLLGHRGACARAPENTIASLRRALLDGAEGFEFDVRMSRDGVPVLMHDETLDRTTDGSGRVASFDRDDLERLDAGSQFAQEFAGERIPELSEVLDEFLGSVALAMELKEPLSYPAFQELADRLRHLDDPELLVASFRPDALASAFEHCPAVPRALILRRGQALPSGDLRRELALWGVFAREEDIDERFASTCRREALELYGYPVNDPGRAGALAAWGVNGLISDNPKVIHPVLMS
jgi:glycerophosphoryl diester phosphodiesterase